MQDEFNEWWEEYKMLYPPKGNASFYYADNLAYARDGFIAGYKAAKNEKNLRCAYCQGDHLNFDCPTMAHE